MIIFFDIRVLKFLICCSVILLTSFSPLQNDPIERMGLKGPIEFNKTDFYLAWSQQPNANYYVQEYLPKGETVENFNQLLTVNVFVMNVTVDNAIQQKVKELTKRKETDKICNFNVVRNPDEKETILDCLLSSGKDEKLDVVEFIIYKYRQLEIDKNKKALLVFSYSKRGYGGKISDFMKNIKTISPDLLKLMVSKQIPKIKIKDQD